jgi:hypothetical protein
MGDNLKRLKIKIKNIMVTLDFIAVCRKKHPLGCKIIISHRQCAIILGLSGIFLIQPAVLQALIAITPI